MKSIHFKFYISSIDILHLLLYFMLLIHVMFELDAGSGLPYMIQAMESSYGCGPKLYSNFEGESTIRGIWAQSLEGDHTHPM